MKGGILLRLGLPPGGGCAAAGRRRSADFVFPLRVHRLRIFANASCAGLRWMCGNPEHQRCFRRRAAFGSSRRGGDSVRRTLPGGSIAAARAACAAILRLRGGPVFAGSSRSRSTFENRLENMACREHARLTGFDDEVLDDEVMDEVLDAALGAEPPRAHCRPSPTTSPWQFPGCRLVATLKGTLGSDRPSPPSVTARKHYPASTSTPHPATAPRITTSHGGSFHDTSRANAASASTKSLAESTPLVHTGS